jgi:hypothetical protein
MVSMFRTELARHVRKKFLPTLSQEVKNVGQIYTDSFWPSSRPVDRVNCTFLSGNGIIYHLPNDLKEEK